MEAREGRSRDRVGARDRTIRPTADPRIEPMIYPSVRAWAFVFALLGSAIAPVTSHAKSPAAVADERPGPGAITPEFPHYDLEELYGQGKIRDGLTLARRRLAEAPDDPELYRHVARFLFEFGEQVDRKDKDFDKIALYQEMLDLLNKALELDPGNAHLLFNRGIALGRLSTTRGVLSSLANLKAVEADWIASANAPYRYRSLEDSEIMPCSAYLTLGIFYRLVPESWLVGVLAGTRGDLDKSLMWLEKADQCSPGRIGILKELGVTQICLGDRRKQPEFKARGLTTLSRALTLPDQHTTGALDKRHIGKIIADPSLACGYSRDGQQELDEKALEREHSKK
jgi:tetratricopeptide (TPR) repeat protein